jgi:magnesium/cobalt transport protein CorA
MDVRSISDEGVAQHDVEDLKALLDGQDGLVWVDIPVCDEEATRVLSEVFGFHPLAVRDCAERNQVPKVRIYPDHVFVVLHTPELGAGGHVHYLELDQFIGPGYVVTVHGPLNPKVSLESALRETCAVQKRLETGRLRPATSFELSYAIVSRLAQRQEEFIGAVTREVWALEQRVMGDDIGDPDDFLEELFRTRHGLLAVSTMGALSREIYGRMANLARFLPADAQPLVEDIVDQFDRVRSLAGGEKDYLQGVIEFHRIRTETRRTVAAERQNEDVRKISAWAAVIAVPTFISGVYGMNFARMPELNWAFGYPAAIALMIVVSLGTFYLFRRIGWL